MSSVQDEAENGHAELIDDEKNEEAGNNEGIEPEDNETASFGPLQEPGELEDEEENFTRNGAGGNFARAQEADSEIPDLPSHQALERPSSADGSLSIPDDTPSIQVHTWPETFRCYVAHLSRAL